MNVWEEGDTEEECPEPGSGPVVVKSENPPSPGDAPAEEAPAAERRRARRRLI